jgi:propionyl-CoA carboxylase beta chain
MVSLIVRKAYGGGYGVMGSKHVGADINLAWPTAEIAVLGPESAVTVLHGRELADSDDSEARRAQLIREYRDSVCNPYTAADRGYVDAVIEPSETRVQIVRALRLLRSKRVERLPRKHGNMPL